MPTDISEQDDEIDPRYPTGYSPERLAARAARLAARPPTSALPPNHYRIRVNRGPFPPMATLEEQFSESGVSCLFNGSYEWKCHSSREGADNVTAEDVVVYAHDFGRPIGSEEAIVWGLANGYLPADEKETYVVGIDPQTRDLQQQNWLIGLGSSAFSGDTRRYVAVLCAVDGRRFLYGSWFACGWYASHRLLFVRK